MKHRLTLLSSDLPLSIVHLERCEKFIEENGLGLAGKPEWLEPHAAAKITVVNAPTLQQMKELRALFAAELIDILCTKDGISPKLLLADMDSTIVTTETLDELAGKAGIKEHIAAITARAMNGELDFHAALRERVSLLKGLPLAALKETLDETVLCDGAAEIISAMKAHGMTCVLVSGGFTYFTGAVAALAGFDHHHGNTLNDDGATLLGTVGDDILDKDAKLAFLKSYAQKLGINLGETIAIGDGANDLPMLAAAGTGIGYRPKPILEESLPNILKYADLDRLKYLL
ncbi:MAG: phosphoserine phosphatase SerB [Micavibrio aeruginosavorus]|uniref:Phosphoserine phosphatase n=1 Tax=Micavibrio aeruginosavorus TaxID=349221 RepID=A0A2W5A5N4_9BACT|nr:MAG: phosphoserine phosphatase SerB [Micavibrio aeruginosavorus]